MLTACAECEAEIDIGEPDLDELFTCPECDAELVVTSIRPLEIEPFSEDMEEEQSGDDDDEKDWAE